MNIRNHDNQQASPTRRGLTAPLYTKEGHNRTAQMLGYTLTLGTSAGWSGFVTVATAWLTEAERAALAFAALKTLRPETAADTFNAAFHGSGEFTASANNQVAA